MIMIRNILIGLLLLLMLFVLIDQFKRSRMLNERRKKRIINREQKLKPEMRDPILKRG
jgi:hypothetical protein